MVRDLDGARLVLSAEIMPRHCSQAHEPFLQLCVTRRRAYATADREALVAIVSDTDRFTSAAPFLFLLASVIVLAFGPGKFSLDAMLFNHPKRP